MIFPKFSFSRRRGAALVVVLMFVVLLTVLVVAFFMKATSYRGLSQSSVNEFKSDTLARSALDLTIADLRQEIRAGSDLFTVGNKTLFIPKTPARVIPSRSGNPALNADGTDPIPNLVRRSVRSDPIASPGVSSRASAASSLDPSRNGKYISAARWNKHYLVPRDPAKYTDPAIIGTDPVTSFEAPDWVYVTAKGPEVLTTSTTSVIGRYAYAIYDEGGLLDINVAGYPSSSPQKQADASSANGKVWGTGNKGGAMSADLTALGLTQAQIDQIVGWRTFATSQPTGTFPNLNFNSDSAKRYFDGVHPHEKSFLTVSNAQVTSGGKIKTDQAFASRQQLLKFRSLIGFPQDALQYLGTFSRDLEQPSFIPNPNRPRVRSAAGANAGTYGTGNDAYGVDRDATPTTDINPPFLRVRAKTDFTRRDGTAALVGDPLVKKRFALSRLGQILSDSTATQNPSDPIYRDFGIYRSNTSEPWKYDHGNSNGILRLDEVAALGREPDFFELLKAAINVGSLGKSAAVTNWNQPGTASQLQHDGHDIFSVLQVLQIGANIMDQYDGDGYPTRIAFAGDPDKEVRGVESLPYLHRIRFRYVQGVTVPAAPPNPASNPGSVIIIPEVWNPHGSARSSDGPTRFRFRAESTLGPGMPTSGKLKYNGPGEPTDTKPIDWATVGTLEFTLSNGTEFNEPVVLSNPGLYSTAGKTRTDTLTTPTSSVTGLVAFDFDRYFNGNPSNAIDTGSMGEPDSGPVSFILEYWNGSTYVPFDRMIVQWTGAFFSPKAGNPGNPPKTWVDYPSKGVRTEFARTDPRSSRWGGIAWGLLGLVEPLDLSAGRFPTSWPSLNMPPFGPKDSGPKDAGFMNAFADYDNSDLAPDHKSRHRGFTQGYWSQNVVQSQPGFFGAANKPFYNRDPDGIARRAMGAYAVDAAIGGSSTNTVGLPLITANSDSRPKVLNRPFRSVAELGYTFRDSPWKNLDLSFPESGDAALLDVFSIDESNNDDATVAGRVNLNTRQAPVLKALLAGGITDDFASTPGTLDVPTAEAIAKKLVERTMSTTTGKGPLLNRADLVGRWTGAGTAASTTNIADPDTNYSGFSKDVGSAAGVTNTSVAFILAQRESAIRSLADAGTTRVWNLMIDLIAQSGRFPTNGAALSSFQAEGEKRYWLHISIDRLTGEVIDRQFEVVTE
jgi:hypothetical protein